MVALGDPNQLAVRRDGEAHGINGRIRWKMLTTGARVADIADPRINLAAGTRAFTAIGLPEGNAPRTVPLRQNFPRDKVWTCQAGMLARSATLQEWIQSKPCTQCSHRTRRT